MALVSLVAQGLTGSCPLQIVAEEVVPGLVVVQHLQPLLDLAVPVLVAPAALAALAGQLEPVVDQLATSS